MNLILNSASVEAMRTSNGRINGQTDPHRIAVYCRDRWLGFQQELGYVLAFPATSQVVGPVRNSGAPGSASPLDPVREIIEIST